MMDSLSSRVEKRILSQGDCDDVHLVNDLYREITTLRAKVSTLQRMDREAAIPLYSTPSPRTELDPEAIADAVIERVVNLDEYTSPDDCPDLLMARQNTLHFIVADVVRAFQEKEPPHG